MTTSESQPSERAQQLLDAMEAIDASKPKVSAWTLSDLTVARELEKEKDRTRVLTEHVLSLLETVERLEQRAASGPATE